MTAQLAHRTFTLLAVVLLAALGWLAVAATSTFSGGADGAAVAQPIDGPSSGVCKLIPGCSN